MKAKRTAFSVYGELVNLAGESITDGIVIARHQDTAEQATVQSDGTFRVMGLQPGKTYNLSAMSDSLSRVFPSNVPIEIAEPTESEPYPDVFGVRFTGIEQPSKVNVVGSAFFEREETTKQYKMLYRESPKLTATLYNHPSDGKPLKTL